MLLSKEKNPKMEEIRKYVQVSSSADFNNLVPHIFNAEQTYLIPLIGQETYDLLQSLYNHCADGYVTATMGDLSSTGSSSEIQHLERLLTLAQSAVIHLAYFIGYDMINSHITDGGFKRVESDHVKSLFKYQEDSLKKYFKTAGFNALDTILQYLEVNIDYFESFKGSDQYTVSQSSFIPGTEVFNRIVFISGSRLTFLRLQPHIALIEQTEIRSVMGEAAYSALKAEMALENPSPEKMAILPYIRNAVAFLSSALLMEESGADLLDNGLYFTSSKATNTNDTQSSPAGSDRIAILVQRNRTIGNAFLDQIRSFLVAHTSDWPGVEPSTGKLLRRNNSDRKTFWA
jgi:hypothetical protein